MISMAMMQRLQANEATVLEPGGEVIGTISEIYLGADPAGSSWMTVKTGLSGSAETFVLLHEATAGDGQTIEVPYTRAFINDAPRVEVGEDLSSKEEHDLFAYYELSYPDGVEWHSEQTTMPDDADVLDKQSDEADIPRPSAADVERRG